MSGSSKGVMLIVGMLMCIPLVGFVGFRIYKGVQFSVNCGGHLKRAADATTVDMAASELKTAIQYLDDNNMKSGYTSILWQGPEEDVGFWHNNLVASMTELEGVSPAASQLERTNILMKLRQTLLDHAKDGEKVTEPEGISIFPNNVGYALASTLFAVMALIGGILFLVAVSD